MARAVPAQAVTRVTAPRAEPCRMPAEPGIPEPRRLPLVGVRLAAPRARLEAPSGRAEQPPAARQRVEVRVARALGVARAQRVALVWAAMQAVRLGSVVTSVALAVAPGGQHKVPEARVRFPERQVTGHPLSRTRRGPAECQTEFPCPRWASWC